MRLYPNRVLVDLCETYNAAAATLTELRSEATPRWALIREYEQICHEIEAKLRNLISEGRAAALSD